MAVPRTAHSPLPRPRPTPAPPRVRRRPRPRPRRRARRRRRAAATNDARGEPPPRRRAQPAQTVSPTASARALASQPPPSSTGWVALQDPASSGRTYYEHAGRGLTTWEKPAELEDDDAELRAALAASAAQPPPVDEDAELRAALALSARERPPAPPAMDDDAELRAVLALSAREASQQPVQQDDDLARALAASLQETRRPAPTDISSGPRGGRFIKASAALPAGGDRVGRGFAVPVGRRLRRHRARAGRGPGPVADVRDGGGLGVVLLISIVGRKVCRLDFTASH